MKNIIFDWSGVVKDAALNQVWVSNYIFNKFGLGPITLSDLRRDWEQPYMNFYKKYLPLGFSREDQSNAYMEAIHHPDCPQSDAVPHMVSLIRKCHERGVFLTVVSSDLAEMLFPELQHYGLEGVFDTVVTDVHDKSEAVQNIIKKYGLKLEDTYFVGDSNHEIEVAHKIGIQSIAVTWGFTSKERLKTHNPDHIVDSPEELFDIILKGSE